MAGPTPAGPTPTPARRAAVPGAIRSPLVLVEPLKQYGTNPGGIPDCRPGGLHMADSPARGPSLGLSAAVCVLAFLGTAIHSAAPPDAGATPSDPLAPWRTGVKVAAVSGNNHHS